MKGARSLTRSLKILTSDIEPSSPSNSLSPLSPLSPSSPGGILPFLLEMNAQSLKGGAVSLDLENIPSSPRQSSGPSPGSPLRKSPWSSAEFSFALKQFRDKRAEESPPQCKKKLWVGENEVLNGFQGNGENIDSPGSSSSVPVIGDSYCSEAGG